MDFFWVRQGGEDWTKVEVPSNFQHFSISIPGGKGEGPGGGAGGGSDMCDAGNVAIEPCEESEGDMDISKTSTE